jgi:hypothetical protein
VKGLLVSHSEGASITPVLRGLRGVGGFRVEPTGNPRVSVIWGDVPVLISLLESWRLGVLRWGPVGFIRPFDHETILNGKDVYSIEQFLDHWLPQYRLPRRVRLRVRGHGLRIQSTLRELALRRLNELNVLPSRRSTVVLSIEAVRDYSGVVRLFIGLAPKYWLLARHRKPPADYRVILGLIN